MREIDDVVFNTISLLSDTNKCSNCNFVQFSGVRYYCVKINEGCLTPLPEERTCKMWEKEEDIN